MSKKGELSSQECLIGLSVIYVVVAVTMNIFCMKSLSFGSPIIICDGGLLISWGVFLISNVIVEVWDERTSVVLVTFAAVVSFIVMLIARLIVFIPTLPEYADQANAFAMIFSNGPRTIIASVLAFWTGNFVNVHIIYKIKMALERRAKDNRLMFFVRAAFSTLIGQLVDNMLFMVLAFAPIGLSVYEMAWFDIMTAVLSGTVIELVLESCLVPFITIPLVGWISRKKNAEAAA
ncbi:MAG: queuosine precursor transporter [Spirochaetales bacterium]|nr:queuosine precursor transporter [Spirochaetales bacterium]MBQ7282713.1 queuosine precursor transporter [Spirochaetales bacterium]